VATFENGETVRVSILSKTAQQGISSNAGGQERAGFSVSAIAIRRHIGTLMLTVTVIVLGVFSHNPYKSISYHQLPTLELAFGWKCLESHQK